MDNLEWLLSRRDLFAAGRQELFETIERRNGEVKAGLKTPEDIAGPNRVDILEANRLDALARSYFDAAEELRRSRLRIAAFGEILKRHSITAPPIEELHSGPAS